MKSPIILWFRRDLRLADNPALFEACATGSPVVGLYIYDPGLESPWAPGSASKWWLHYSLSSLDASLRKKGSQLILRAGPTISVLMDLLKETGSRSVYWNRLYEPQAHQADETVRTTLAENGINVLTFNASLLKEPWETANSSGRPYQVFTPFWKDLKKNFQSAPSLPPPAAIKALTNPPKSMELEQLNLLPGLNWAANFYNVWTPGEEGARASLRSFISNGIAEYSRDRDKPSETATSKLSPHLHYGEIGPRQVWFEVEESVRKSSTLSFDAVEPYLRQLAWREFAHHLLFHYPKTTTKPLRSKFEGFPWNNNPNLLSAWQRGETGYPLVDAGMRELWSTGTMHNRVRMIAASFLVKHLLQPWQEGAAWFWDTLVDADLANNTMGWQWVSGCGADAAPYFRIFNPVIQGEKFDPDGLYVKRWIPQLKNIPAKLIHKPWQCSAEVLRGANVVLGKDYPFPIVDHAQARDAALDAYADLKNALG